MTQPTRLIPRLLSLMLLTALTPFPAWAEPTGPADSTRQAASLDIDALRKAARAAQQAEDWPKAIGLWTQLLQLKPDDNQALRRRGSAYSELGQHDLALADQIRAVELEPNNSYAQNSLCWGGILANRPLTARPACEKGVALDSNSMADTVNLGHTYLLAGDIVTAHGWYEKAIPLLGDEADLKQGPLRDFDLFIQRGWQVEASRKWQGWFAERGDSWLNRLAPALKKQNDNPLI